ncbi:Hypothetical protein PHPALM_36471 [Phytophthora palmivora]|uniref:Reverse transcriptase domain-containing protein n=1 Tax=Phytophthora palmivora TaxID=4796 RepID=A0A2P4WZV5_9STRA|nr:Hypothetical protein PHPALM_36471 [Phytophthora palmivora]
MSRFRLESDGDAVMTVPQPIFEWKRARTQYDETVRERCQWSGEDYDTVLRGIRTAVDPELLEFLANYEIGKDKADITDKDIMTKQLRMDLSIKDVPDRVAQYFRLFERVIMDNGFQDNLGSGSATDDNDVARMKQRTKFLVDNLSPTMLRDEIKRMLVLVKYRHIRINDQLLHRLLVDLQIRTAVGPVNLYKIKCVVVEGEDQFLLSKVIMKRLGIDVKRVFEQFANTCIDLNLDDIPDEPDVGDSVEGEVEYEMNRMCKDVRTVLSDEHYASFRDEVIKLSKEFTYLYRTRIGPDEPARVEPLKVTLKKGVEPYRCKPRKYPPAQNKFLDEHIAQLMQFEFIKKNNLSKWASNAVSVRKSDDKTGFRVTNAYIDVNKRTVHIAGTMPHLSVVLCFVAGVKFIAKFDMFKGFWQIMLAEECQEIFSFMSHDGVCTPLRVPQGATDSALHFQNQMQTVYKPLLYKGALVWIDDVIVYGKTEDEFLANLKLFYELTGEYRLKINAKKSFLGVVVLLTEKDKPRSATSVRISLIAPPKNSSRFTTILMRVQLD